MRDKLKIRGGGGGGGGGGRNCGILWCFILHALMWGGGGGEGLNLCMHYMM